jgi:hypothetical protein
MATSRLDTIARLFASRRAAQASAAHQATPPAWDGEKVPYLFVQSFESGTFALKAGSTDAFTLTLDHGLGQTIYFSDRPERVVGATPTGTFLARFPFGAADPPNAALVLETAPGDTDVVVVELTSPAYDAATRTATYDAKVLSDYEKLGMTFRERPEGPGEVHAEFGAASLFIDDCPNGTIYCLRGPARYTFDGSAGFCWNWGRACCEPCAGTDYWTQQCNIHEGRGVCDGECTVTYEGFLACG